MKPLARPRCPGGRWLAALLLAAAPGPAAAAPAPGPPPALPFLAPPPLTSNQPEAPPLVEHPAPSALETPAAKAAPEADATPAEGPRRVPVAIPNPLFFIDPAGDPDHLAEHLLVVYNAKDPESRSLALYYAQRRQIPPERVLAITCSTGEEITRDAYERTIHQPILEDLLRHHWLDRRVETATVPGRTVRVLAATRNDIWAIVLMRGVPLKIADSPSPEPGMETQPQLQTNAAAVDSELALLPIEGLPLGGFALNPFFDSHNAGEVRAGPELATQVVLVTRLDGPSAADVRRMIDDCLAAEKERLAGEAVIDSRDLTDPANPYTRGDEWFRTARDLLADDGWQVVFDNWPETLPATSTVNHVALYLGWYASEADGPWVTPPVRFVRGAIAYHLHSFSAWTIRSTTRHWVGPLIANGADATMGCVYEPYLLLTPHVDIFTQRLLDGDSFAEAAYACQPGLSWMTTVVGDPLYRPFRTPVAEAVAAPGSRHREWLLLRSINQELDEHPPRSAAALEKMFDVPGAGPVFAEELGDLLRKLRDPAAPADAERAYESAFRQSTEPVDCIRLGLKLAALYGAEGDAARAKAELAMLRQSYPVDAERFGVPNGRVQR